jgi:cardiolipin synthase
MEAAACPHDRSDLSRPCPLFRVAAGRLNSLALRLGLPVSRCDILGLLHRGDVHFDRLAEAIAIAESEVAVEMYQLVPDAVGVRVMIGLAAAADRGVRVRLLLDAWGSAGMAPWLRRLRRRGVEARWYAPWRPWNSPTRRTHRKLVVVDGACASIGGMNLTSQFSEEQRGRQAWRDVSLWLEGEAAAILAAQFEEAWRQNGGTPRPVPQRQASEAGGDRAIVVGGADGRHGHGDAYRALVDEARRELLIANPYFMPGEGFRARLVAAVRRGVRVVVVVPGRSDLPAFKHAARRHFAALLRAGVEIWERRDRMIHAKVAVVDGSVAAVGSVNVNRRSFAGNSEALVLTDEPRVVDGLHGLVLGESLAAAEPFTAASWPRQAGRWRLAEALTVPVSVLF